MGTEEQWNDLNRNNIFKKALKTIHYNDVLMSVMASQISSISIVCAIVCSGANLRKHQSSPSLAFVKEIQWWPMNSQHKGPVSIEMIVKNNSCTQTECWPKTNQAKIQMIIKEKKTYDYKE